jgi:hypothetical protein
MLSKSTQEQYKVEVIYKLMVWGASQRGARASPAHEPVIDLR